VLQVLVDADNVDPFRTRAVLAALPAEVELVVAGHPRALARVEWPESATVVEAAGWQRADLVLAEAYRPSDDPLVLLSGDGDFGLLVARHSGPVLVVSEAASYRLAVLPMEVGDGASVRDVVRTSGFGVELPRLTSNPGGPRAAP
jgi:hypothetical protein